MAAPSLRALGTVVSGNTTAPSFAAPAGAVSTDVILIGMFVDDGRTTVSAVPSNFTLAPNLSQINDATLGPPSHALYVYWGRFSDVGSGPYGFTLTNSFGSPFVEGRTAAIQGCITSGSPWDATNGATSGNTNVTTAPSVSATSTGTDRYAFYAATNWTGGAWTPATGYTEQWDANDQIITFDDLAMPTAATTTSQATCVGNNRSNAWVGIMLPTGSAQPPALPARTVQGRDPGETWWIQRDRRDANTVGSAANPLPSPLDSAWQAGARHWHLYGDAADAAPRTWQSLQRVYTSDPNLLVPPAAMPAPAPPRTVPVRDPGETWWQQRPGSDPNLLATAELENELLGGAGTAQRYLTPASNVARWWMPQQPARVGTTPGLLDIAELEGALLGGAETAKRNLPATHADRREVPAQRPYISDPSFYPTTAPTDPLTLAWGAGGTYWLLYNTAALQVDRRDVPQQRRYLSDPALLLTALLENELLGSADDARRRYGWAYADRRETVPPRPVIDPNEFAGAPADPLLLAGGVGGDLWRRYNTAITHDDRRETAVQPPRWTLYFDAGPDVPPLTLAWGAGGDLWHRYNRAARREPWSTWPAPHVVALVHVCITPRPATGTTGRPTAGTTARPNTGITTRPC